MGVSTEEKLQVCRGSKFSSLFFDFERYHKKCFFQQVTMATVLTPQVTRVQCLWNDQIKKIDVYEANEIVKKYDGAELLHRKNIRDLQREQPLA